jgi:predicted AAA+ superfamily ATPase
MSKREGSDMIIDRLNEQNPWWRSPDTIASDGHIRRAARAAFSWRPSLLNEVDLTKPYVYTIRGPRQVGKTTTVKFLIQRLIEGGSQWPRILYYSLDLEREAEVIVSIVTETKAFFPRERGPWCIFLDEISSVPDWQKGIKYLRDQTTAAEDCFVLTGSSAADIRAGAERLPGRRGGGIGLDKIILPLSFRDFCLAQGVPGPPEPQFTLKQLLASDSEDALREGMRYLSDLRRALETYVTVGGFPAALQDYLTTGRVTEATVRMLWDLVAGDVDRLGYDRLAAVKLLERVARSLGAATSWRNLAEEMGVGGAETAQRYVTALAEAFAILVVYFWDRGGGGLSLKKNKKLYLVDPLFAEIPQVLQPGGPTPAMATMVENIVGMALYRAGEQEIIESFSLPQSLFYWRSRQGNEVDFVSGPGSRKIPVEVKYQQTITGRDKLVIRNSFGEGLVLSGETLDLDDQVRVIPAPLFLWLLKTEA